MHGKHLPGVSGPVRQKRKLFAPLKEQLSAFSVHILKGPLVGFRIYFCSRNSICFVGSANIWAMANLHEWNYALRKRYHKRESVIGLPKHFTYSYYDYTLIAALEGQVRCSNSSRMPFHSLS
jgi:hypothetical protein